MIVLGLIAFDNCIAVMQTFPTLCSRKGGKPSIFLSIKALILPVSRFDSERIISLTQAVKRLQQKSRSFYVASSTFAGELRIDLILL